MGVRVTAALQSWMDKGDPLNFLLDLRVRRRRQHVPHKTEYGRGVNTFSPKGRLFHVEYTIEAITFGSTAIGLKTKDGVVLAVEKRMTSPLLVGVDQSSCRGCLPCTPKASRRRCHGLR